MPASGLERFAALQVGGYDNRRRAFGQCTGVAAMNLDNIAEEITRSASCVQIPNFGKEFRFDGCDSHADERHEQCSTVHFMPLKLDRRCSQ